MDSTKFGRLFSVILICLQIIGIILMFFLYSKFRWYGMIAGGCFLFGLYVLIFFLMSKIHITKNGKNVKIWDVFSNIIEITVVLIVSSILFTILGMVIGHKFFENVKIWGGIPILSTAILYGSLAASSELFKHGK